MKQLGLVVEVDLPLWVMNGQETGSLIQCGRVDGDLSRNHNTNSDMDKNCRAGKLWRFFIA